MKTEVCWHTDKRLSASIRNRAVSGPPWLGVIRRKGDRWLALSTLYAAPHELGMWDTPDQAWAAIVTDAENLLARRAHAKAASEPTMYQRHPEAFE